MSLQSDQLRNDALKRCRNYQGKRNIDIECEQSDDYCIWEFK